MRRLRLVACVAGIAVTAALASACGGGQTAKAADPPSLVQYNSNGLSFRHPAAWKEYPFVWAGELHFQPIVYLSTQPVHDPCSTHGNDTSCGLPIGHLQPGGVLVVWQNPYVLPGTTLGSAGSPMRVGGRPARRTTSSGGVCRSVGADRTIDVLIKSSPAPNQIEATACLRGPNLAQNERRLNALLASTRFQAS